MILGKIICVDAGHCGTKAGFDPGACQGEYKEAAATLAIAKKVQSKLKAEGYKVVMTRTGEKNLSLAQRCKISNDNNCDIFVSIHLNAATSSDANGVECLRYPKVGARTKNLANNIQTSLVAATGFRNRGVKERGDLYVLKHTTASAVLIECGFLSNDTEKKKLFNSAFQNKIADAIVKGVNKTLK